MIHFDREVEPANDIVVLRMIEGDVLSSKSSGFVVGDDMLRNLRVGFYQIVKIGIEAKEKTGLEAGAYVFADNLASFYHTEPICLMRYTALIMETNLEKTKYRALGGRCIVQEAAKNADETSGFVIPTSDEMKIGVIKAISEPYEKPEHQSPFKVGDKVLLTKEECDELHGFNGDSSLDPCKPIYIYKTENIICKIND